MNTYNPNIHHRKSIRLKGYDYSQAGLYFITICVQNRESLFGEIVNEKMILNDAGKMVQNEWLKLPNRFKNIELHEFIVMPNHFHAILEIVEATVGATLVVAPNKKDDSLLTGRPQGHAPTIDNAPTVDNAPTDEKGSTGKTLGDMVGAFQSIITVNYIRGVKTLGWQPFNGKLLQRNYYENIIRNEKSYQTISEYIINNPHKWNKDKFYTV